MEAKNSSARILDAALSLFAEKGYEAGSTREICQLAGITKPTLYYFYENKEGVYRALTRSAMDDFVALVDTAIAEEGGLRERMRLFAQAMFRETNRRPVLARFLFSIVWNSNAPFAREVHNSYTGIVKRVSRAVAAAQELGEIKPGDADVRTLVFMGALAEAISNFLVTGSPKLTTRLADSIVETVFEGWESGRKKKFR